MSAPVVLFLFNRPEQTCRAFAAIRRARPERLFLVADGPRHGAPDDPALCAGARDAVAEVDWPCRVERFYAPTNLGCSPRIAGGLDRVFGEVDRAIVLEDDIDPDPGFFDFCTELLDRYQGDQRIHMISGRNELGIWDGPGSYFASRHGSIWGWATWRRAWREYDPCCAPLTEDEAVPLLEGFLGDPDHSEHQFRAFRLHRTDAADNWDNQFAVGAMLRGRFALVPRRNLAFNTGFGAAATHSRNPGDIRADVRCYPADLPIRHPPGDVTAGLDDRYDRWSFLWRCLTTYADPKRLHLWLRLTRRAGTTSASVDDVAYMLAPLRHPEESLAVLDHVIAACGPAPRVSRLRQDMAWIASAR